MMQKISCIDVEEVIEFFKDHCIIPGETSLIEKMDFLSILFDAIELDKELTYFIRAVLISSDNNYYVFTIENWISFKEAYNYFSTQFINSKKIV